MEDAELILGVGLETGDRGAGVGGVGEVGRPRGIGDFFVLDSPRGFGGAGSPHQVGRVVGDVGNDEERSSA